MPGKTLVEVCHDLDLAEAEQATLSAFAARLAALRAQRGLGVRELGRLAGINHESVRKAEAGHNLTLGHAARLARALGVPLTDLLADDA